MVENIKSLHEYQYIDELVFRSKDISSSKK